MINSGYHIIKLLKEIHVGLCNPFGCCNCYRTMLDVYLSKSV